MKLKLILLLTVLLMLAPILAFSGLLVGFSRATNRSPFYFLDLLKHSLLSNQVNAPFNTIILGLDPRHDWLENTETTDTIIAVNFQPTTARVNLVSLPRDLWDYNRQTKINHIYQDLKAQSLVQTLPAAFKPIIGQDLEFYVVIDTQDLIDFVSTIGGVDVYLDQGFKDDQYPNPEYIRQVNSTAPPYITIEFPSGQNHLDQSNVAGFVRSRKSSDNPNSGGTDLGRIKRQQLLIDAIIRKLSTPDFFLDPQNIANLYLFWHQNIETNIPDTLLADLLVNFLPKIKSLHLNSFNVDTVIYHPTRFINNQWVFLPLSPDYRELHQYIGDSFSP